MFSKAEIQLCSLPLRRFIHSTWFKEVSVVVCPRLILEITWMSRHKWVTCTIFHKKLYNVNTSLWWISWQFVHYEYGYLLTDWCSGLQTERRQITITKALHLLKVIFQLGRTFLLLKRQKCLSDFSQSLNYF